MRWFLLLFSLNVAFAFWQWADLRVVKVVAEYELEDRAIELVVSDGGEGCILLGPVLDSARAEQVQEALMSEGLDASLVKREVEKAPRYWVYFGPLPDYASALEQYQKFKQESIDSFIITREDLYGALSMGVFENIDSARRMQALLKRKGYQTSIRNIFKFESQWWLEISLGDNRENLNKIKGITDRLGVGLELREFFCKTVAS